TCAGRCRRKEDRMSDDENAVAKAADRSIERGTQAWFQVASLDQAIAVAKHIHASGMAPKGYEKAEAIVTAIIFGGELGLGPLASLQSIAVINGKPSIYGDAMLALCQRDSAYVSHDEGLEGDLK